jgi:hypothetical protein
MSEEHLMDFEGKLKELEEEENAAEEAIEIKQEVVESEGENIRQLEGLVDKFKFTRSLYESVPKKEIISFDDPTYQEFIAPLTDISTPGLSAVYVRDESRDSLGMSRDHLTILTSVNTTGGAAAVEGGILAKENPKWFPNHEEIIERHKPTDELEKNIEYVKSQLPHISPDISQDFDAFLKKYYAFKVDSTKYQDLIGARSMLFFKLIFDFSEKNFAVTRPREDQIRKFIFGNTPSPPSAEPVIKDAKRLWDELSSQDPAGQSVKTGSVTSAYIERLFRRLIGVMTSLLKLRKAYFS